MNARGFGQRGGKVVARSRIAAPAMNRRDIGTQTSALFCENLLLVCQDLGLIGLDPFLVAADRGLVD